MMTIKELLAACDPATNVRVRRVGEVPGEVICAWDLLFHIRHASDERVMIIEVRDGYMLITLYHKEKVNEY